ncbi:M23 family metallopeptidase [Winogradskyella sp. A3E31]|uniref:M23 family metallopeptidase n=1 Tax=Winogradskyella sp. A3E31 TaxID=3349637 RepID=UPI00398B4BE5
MSCSKDVNKPGFIEFEETPDSLLVIYKNKLFCPVYAKIKHKSTQNIEYVQVNPKSDTQILSFLKSENDTLNILKNYQFSGHYGLYDFKTYDTTYNYALPFLKDYKSSIIQGYNGQFSHKGQFSSKTLDFSMDIGDTIVAARDGVVISTIVNHNKQGTTEDFRKYGNYIMVYHDDNTFSQYVHLKQNGNLVAVGDSIKRNQPIALSGFTGLTTTPHLHFGVYKPTHTGFESIDIIIDSIPAKELKRGQIIIKD